MSSLVVAPAAPEIVSQCIQPDRIAAGLAPFSGNFCTANDLTFVLIGLGIQQDGCVSNPDSANVLNLRAVVENTGASTRYDAGLWISTQGNVTRCSLTGQLCTVDADCGGGQNVCVATARWGGCVREILREPGYVLSSGLPTLGTCSISGAACRNTFDCPSGQTCGGGICDPTVGGVNLACGGAPPPTRNQGPYINEDADGCGDVLKFGASGPPDCGRTVDLRVDPTNSTCNIPDGPTITASPANIYQDQTVFDFDGSITLPCVDRDANGFLEIPTCTSWGQNAADIACARKTCSGGLRAGLQCAADPDCPGSTCATPSCSICSGSNASCTTDAGCPIGQICRGVCSNTGSYCNPNQANPDADCGAGGTCSTLSCQGSGDPCATAANCPSGQLCSASADPVCRTQQAVPGTSSKCNCIDGLNSNVPAAALTASCSCTPPTTVRPGFPVTCTLSYNNPQPANCSPNLSDPERFQCGAAGYLRFDLDDGIGGAASGTFAGLCSGGPRCSNAPGTSCSTNSDCVSPGVCQVPTCNTDADCLSGTCSLATSLGAYSGLGSQLQWTPRSVSGSTLGIVGTGDSRSLTFAYTPSSSAPDGPITLPLTTLYANKTCSISQTLCELDSQCPMGETCVLDFTVDPRTQPLTATCSLNVNATHATIASVSAFADGGRVTVEWETASEVGTVGFELDRLDPATGQLLRVNPGILPATQHAPGALYRFVDELAPLDQHLVYQVVEIDHHGQRHEHGPFAVELAAASSVPLSLPAVAVPDGGSFHALAKAPSARHAQRVAAGRRDQLRQLDARAKASPTFDRLRIAVRDSGLYQVSAAQLAAAWGETEKQIANDISHGRLQLGSGGAEVAWEATADGSGLLFYGEAIDSAYTLDNVYWLTRGRGSQIAASGGQGPAAAAGTQSFRDRVHLEKDVLGRPGVASDPDDDYWFWNGVIGSGLLTFPIELQGVAAAPGSAQLTVGLWGFGSGSGVRHSAVVELNGQTIGQLDWSGTGSHSAAFPFDQSLLAEGSNTVKVLGLGGSFFVDSFDVDYDRLYRTETGSLMVRGDGHEVITVSGFGSDRIRVYDLSDPAAPERVGATTIDQLGGSFRVSFEPATATTPYYVVADGAWRTAVDIAGVSPSALRDPSNGAAYLVIAPAALMAPAEALADYRRSRGLEAMAVDLADIMAEFNDGVSHPAAIRDFLAYAYSSWRTRPRYVTLAGKGSHDYRDLLGLGGNLVPPLMAPTSEGLVPSDNAFGDLVGNDRMPELSIGRLPALSAQELWDMLAKIQGYELSAGGSWTERALVVADDADSGGDFAFDSDALAARLPEAIAVEKIYLHAPLSLAEARQAILTGIDQGALYVSYAGHGGFDRLASDGLLLSSDVAALANQEKLPLVTALTCNIGMFSFPGFTSLGEKLVGHPGGGAIAVWGPMGLSFNYEATRMGEQLIGSLFDAGRQRPIGDALREALEGYLAGGGSREMLSIYGLLGDSALMLH